MNAPATIDVTALADIAARCPSARLVVLFGSVARGSARPWSDADLGIAGCDYWESLALGAALAAAVGREPHVTDLDRAPEALRYEIAQHGVLLFEREAGLWVRYRAESFVRWFDFAPYRRLFLDSARRRLLAEARRG